MGVFFTEAEHIVNWNFAHESWHCPKAENNLEIGANFSIPWLLKTSRQVCFSWNVYRNYSVSKIEYHIEDGRKVEVFFHKIDENTTEVFERFEPEMINALKCKNKDGKAFSINLKIIQKEL